MQTYIPSEWGTNIHFNPFSIFLYDITSRSLVNKLISFVNAFVFDLVAKCSV